MDEETPMPRGPSWAILVRRGAEVKAWIDLHPATPTAPVAAPRCYPHTVPTRIRWRSIIVGLPRRRRHPTVWVPRGRPAIASLRLPCPVEELPPPRLGPGVEVVGHPARIWPQEAARYLLVRGLLLRLPDRLREVAGIKMVEESHELTEVHVRHPLVTPNDQHFSVVACL